MDVPRLSTHRHRAPDTALDGEESKFILLKSYSCLMSVVAASQAIPEYRTFINIRTREKT